MKERRFIMLVIVLISFPTCVYSQFWKGYADSAKIYNDQKNVDKAIELYEKAAEELKKDSAGTSAYARINMSLANLYTTVGEYEKAESLYIIAKQIREKVSGKENADYASSCNQLGRLYRIKDEYQKAEPLIIEGMQIRERVLGKESVEYAASCNNLATLYQDIGQYKKSELLYEESKQLREKLLGKENYDYAGSCNNLALLFSYMGQYEKAEPLFIEAIQILEKVIGRDNPDYAKSCDNLGNLYIDMNKYERAEQLYLQAKQIRERTPGKDSRDYAESCSNLANLYNEMGQYEKAESYYLEAKQIKQKALNNNPYDYAAICINLGNFYNVVGQYEKAEPLLLEAKQIFEKILSQQHPAYATTCTSLANLYENMRAYTKAEPLYLQAREIQEKVLGKEHSEYASTCNNLGNLYNEMGQYQKAERFYLESIQLTEKVLGREHRYYRSNCIDLANFYWKIKQPEKASDFFAKAYQSHVAQIAKVFQFTSEAEKQSYLKTIADFNDDFLSFNTLIYSHVPQPLTYNVSLSSRNLILYSSQQLRYLIYNSADTSVQNKYNKWVNAREQLSFWYTKPVADRPAYVKDLEEQANVLEKELTRISSAFKTHQPQRDMTWQAIQQDLKSNEAAIEFADFSFYNGERYTDSTYYIALVLRRDKPQPELIKLFEKKQLDSLLNDNDVKTLYTLNSALYTLTWKPLEKYLKGISKIYFAPAGDLFKISFAAIPVNDTELLSDKYRLIQLNTTASARDKAETYITASDRLQLYGGIEYNADTAALKQLAMGHRSNDEMVRSIPDDLQRSGSIQYLPGTQEEVGKIKDQAEKATISVTSLSGINATEESFKSLNGTHSPSVLHIATHGFFFPDPRTDKRDSIQRRFEGSGKVFKQSDNPLFRSGLLFAGAGNSWQGRSVNGIEDGIVTAYDVSNMYLPNTKLVVLSACETALGDVQGSEGVYGLQRAFKMAGVPNLVMSLWKVPDAETSEFMQLFYQNMFNKESIGEAFYQAQAAMKNKYRNDPVKWAAWVLVR